jgi:FkbM family methyltransferase
MRSARGFSFVGSRWLAPWLTYLFHPVLGRVFRGRVVNLGGIRVRLGEMDLFCLANVFCDYDIGFVREHLRDVHCVIDAGANIGDFSFVVRLLNPTIRIVALEPDSDNYRFLTEQPFAGTLECRQQALGPREGFGRMMKGEDAARHSVEFGQGVDQGVEVVTIRSLSAAKTLLKMDIEGAEKEVFRAGLPDTVRYVLFEWHYPEDVRRFCKEGDLRYVAAGGGDATMWAWTNTRASAQ